MLSKDGFFTTEQDEWLKKHYPTMDRKECVIEFNRTFGTDRNINAVSDRATRRLNLHRLDNKGSFAVREREELPLGSIRKSQTGTYIKVKNTGGDAHISGYQRPYWIPLQEKIYTDKYELPKGYMVIFLDNNRENFDIDNLYPINRKISAVMSKNKWWTDNRENTLTAIKWCELYYAINK